MGVGTFVSGRGAERVVKDLEGVNAAAIEPHQEAAGLTLVTYILAALAALFALTRRAIPRWAATLVIVLTFFATASSVYTALLGGRIHHPETKIRAR